MAGSLTPSHHLQNGEANTGSMNGGKPNVANNDPFVPKRLYATSRPPSLDNFKDLITQKTDPTLYQHAASIASNVPIYNIPSLPFPALEPEIVDRIQDEWHHILLSGPGVFVLKGFYSPSASTEKLLHKVNTIFNDIINFESSTNTTRGDHFATSGNNARIWNSYQKHAMSDPSSFVQYYSNPWLALVAETWLGQSYQITAQVNIVKPGGKPQVSHRDYHLGFQTAEECSSFPKATQIASQFLTLQGAVAHSDMPLESGPTRFLPFSQLFEEGYMAYRLREFQEFFERSWVSVPLELGDAVFFNPALFHAAGENTSSGIERSANLLQISSAFGKTMESIDTVTIIERCWPDVRRLYQEQGGLTSEVEAILKSIARGYPFPTNLDRRPPEPGGMAPESELNVLRQAVQNDWITEKVISAITTIRNDSLP
jgi:ectoine hydroxylase-related dioxygenase (phytanoyl-CoA dioxygenase family)